MSEAASITTYELTRALSVLAPLDGEIEGAERSPPASEGTNVNERERAKLVATEATLEDYSGRMWNGLRDEVDSRIARRDWRRYVRGLSA